MSGGASASANLAETMVCGLLSMSPRRLAAVLADAPERSAPWVRAAAEYGFVEGQVRYGRLLLEGQGVARDPAQALAWFRRAAEAGDAEGQNMVGRCLENAWGVAADLAEAALWYHRAAEAGHAWAQYNLGHLYLDGLGVARDAVRALSLYRQAADQGHARAMNLVGRCLEQGWGAPRDPIAARDWYRRSSEAGYFRGQYNFASLLVGEGLLDDAAAMFAKAVEGAPATSRRLMAEALVAGPHARLQAIGRRGLETLEVGS